MAPRATASSPSAATASIDQCRCWPDLADLDAAPVVQLRAYEFLQIPAVVCAKEARKHRRGDHLSAPTRTVIALDRNAKPLLRQRRAIGPFRAGLHEHRRAEVAHDVGHELAGAGNRPRPGEAGPLQPPRRDSAFWLQTPPGRKPRKSQR